MPWKVGGNFETTLVTCEANWKECAIGIVNYLWCELVFDVVDYLATEGTILWILTIAVTSVILLRMKCHKSVRAKNVIVSKHLLNRIGYKIHDLELKVNVLTYKVQYGTWPLPHQIYNLNPKSQKIRATLSDPGNQNNWLKQLPLSPMESIVHTTYSSVPDSSVTEPVDFFEIKQKNYLHAQDGKSPMDCSSIKISKSTSNQFINTCSQQSEGYTQNMHTWKSDQSDGENFTLQRRNVQLLPLDMDRNNDRSWKSFSIQNDEHVVSSTNTEYDSSQRFTDTAHKCKSFLKESESNGKRLQLLNYSLEKSELSSSSDIHVTRQAALLMTEKRNAYCSIRKPTKKNITSETKYMDAMKERRTMKNIYERRNNVDITSTMTSNDGDLSKQLASSFPITQPAHNLRFSQETLHEIRKRLQSLHNMLRMYKNTSGFSAEEQKSLDPVGKVVEAFVSAGSRIEQTDEKKTDANCDPDTKKDLQQMRCSVDNYECFELDHSEQNLSSLTECSSNTSNKTYRFSSNVASRNIHSKKYNQRGITKKMSNQTSNLPAVTTIQSKDSSPFYNAMLYAGYYENRRERNACECNILDRSRSYELESNTEINGNVAETDASFNLTEKKSEICTSDYILSPELTEDNRSKNQTFSIRTKETTGKFNDTSDEEQYRENVISRSSSRSKISKNSDREEKSTTMLLQEALHFKKALLMRAVSEKENLLHITEDNSNPDKSASEDEMQNKSNNNFSSMMLDIKTERSDTDASLEKINQHYVYLEMNQRRDIFPQSLQNVNAFVHRENERSAENKSLKHRPETPSEYFSISDLAIHDDGEIDTNVTSPLEPIHEKIISITIPINVENEDVIKTNEKSIQTKTVLEDVCASSRQNLIKNSSTDDTGNDATNLSMTLKLEDLILERVKNIRDCMDTFLRNQNRVISKTRKALRSGNENDIFQCSNEASHIITNNRSATFSRCDKKNVVAESSENLQRPDLLINTLLPNYKHKVSINSDILRCCSDLHLKRNPEMFMLIAPIKSTFSNENDTRLSKLAAELERKKTDLSSSVTFKYPCENDSRVTKHNTISLDKSSCKKHMTLNITNSKVDEQTTADTSTDFPELGKQTHTENKFSEIYFEFDNPRGNANIVTRIIGNGHEHATRSRHNLISKISSHFTDEATSGVKTEKVPLESTSNMMHLHTKSHQQGKIEADVKCQTLINKCSNTDMVRASKLPLNTKRCNLNAFTDVNNLIPNKSGHDYTSDVKTTLKRSDIYDIDTSLLPFSMDINEKILHTNNSSVNDIEQHKNDETLTNVARFSPRIEDDPIKRLYNVNSRIKAKSDISLIGNVPKNLKINCPKRSHFLLLRDPSEDTCKMLRQSNIHDNKSKYAQSENESRSTIKSRCIVPSQRISKFSIPIFKDHLGTAHGTRGQTHAKSPTRSPLTMLRREKTCTKSRTANEEVTREINIPINQLNLSVKETKLNSAKLNTQGKVLVKELEKKYKNSNVTTKDNSPYDEQNIESLEINKTYSDKRLLCSNKADIRVMKSTKNTAPKTVATISIATNDNLPKKYSVYFENGKCLHDRLIKIQERIVNHH